MADGGWRPGPGRDVARRAEFAGRKPALQVGADREWPGEQGALENMNLRNKPILKK